MRAEEEYQEQLERHRKHVHQMEVGVRMWLDNKLKLSCPQVENIVKILKKGEVVETQIDAFNN